mmetsp:Transcript_62034/g.72538  ORF Transcript_62034/g.72538 Transcript_62034/m.72538 type:complete len:168 (+) Transcript_62034:3-506(+)
MMGYHQRCVLMFLGIHALLLSPLQTMGYSQQQRLKSEILLDKYKSNIFMTQTSRRTLLGQQLGILATTATALVNIPSPAVAYDNRDVGGDSKSASTAAQNIQAKETNSRLEKSGYKLDTREEEAARLSDAMASFSYGDSASNIKGVGDKRNNNNEPQKKTYGNGYKK